MHPQTDGDYQKLITDVIKKQIVILGPDITLAKARNVKGLSVADDGTVTAITGSPQVITQALIEQFMELSGEIVKKTMEPLLANYPDGMLPGAGQGITQAPTTPQAQPLVANPVNAPSSAPTLRPDLPTAPVQNVQQPAPQQPQSAQPITPETEQKQAS